ncbi:MAG: histidine kinase [Betaproteobacteria bacterium]|nr:histidine kinase [Betaproteobacteria bacterium]
MAFFNAKSAGPGYLNSGTYPLAWLANQISAQFTQPPTLVSAGSDWRLLSFDIYVIASLVMALLFAYAFWLRTDPDRVRSERRDSALLAAQLPLALAGNLDFTYFFVMEVAVFLPLRAALKWFAAALVGSILAQLSFLITGGLHEFVDVTKVLTRGLAMMIMQGMAFGVGVLIAAERQSRVTLATAHGKLLATQQLLGDTVRASERTRIARDLHDAIGHHLTALTLHLDLASRKATGAKEVIGVAQSLARELLSEVRTVVGVERQSQAIDLKRALQTLCDSIPVPRIELAVGETVAIDSPAIAQALFHSIQEAITNTMRHAKATRLCIDICGGDCAWVATIIDDGIGKRGAADGNGLTGIRERVEELGGTFTESEPTDGGYCLTISLPRGAWQ